MLSELDELRQRVRMLEQERIQVQTLLEDAAKGASLEKYGRGISLYVDINTGIIEEANPNALEFLGYDLKDLVGMPITHLEIPDPDSVPKSYLESAIDIQVFHCRYRHAQGYELPVLVQRWRIPKDNKRVYHYSLIDESLSAQVWRELNRREDSDHQFREKLKVLNEVNGELGKTSSFDALCRRTVELGLAKLGFDRLSLWFLDRANKMMEGSFGVDESGIIRDERGLHWSFENTFIERFLTGDWEPVVTSEGAPLYDDQSKVLGYGWHISAPLLDGETLIGYLGADNYLHKQALRSYQPELLRLYGVTVGHLCARQREQETIRKLSNAIQRSTSMVLIVDKNRRIEFANESFCHISGYALDEVLGHDLGLFFPPLFVQNLWQKALQGQDWHGELSQRKKSGDPYEVLLSISGIHNHHADDPIAENVIIVQEDISDLKQAQQNELELKLEHERVQMLETFVTDIGHEFKTPLSIINTGSYLLNILFRDNERAQQYCQQISDQVFDLNQMLDEILEVVRLERNPQFHLELIPLERPVKEVIQALDSYFSQKSIGCKTIWEDYPLVQVDTEQFGRAFREILHNAIQYTPDGGHIQIRVKRDGNWISTRVEDTGVGIPAEEIPHIFRRFYRVDKARTLRGTGLGLPIAQAIIEAHRGEIRVESVVGQGSCFEIRLPSVAEG